MARYMRVVTYARVSTKSQGERGTSLEDQENRFSEWIAASGNVCVHGYKESKSGGDIAHRKQFLAMLEELPLFDPRVDAVVVDSLDRFTRDKFLGIEKLGALRDMGIKLWELEKSDETPLDLTSEADRNYVWQKFADAEGERNRIQKRQIKRYKEQRNRNATTTNRPPFGLRLAGDRKGNRTVEADPGNADIVRDVDDRIIAGESQNSILQSLRPIPGAWRSRRGLTLALKNEAYVDAKVRTVAVQRRLLEILATRRQAYGEDRNTKSRRVHSLSGLMACKHCVDKGIAPEDALMHGRYVIKNKNQENIVCDGRRKGERQHPKEFWVSTHKVLGLIVDKLEWLRKEEVAQAVLAKWAQEPKTDKTARQRRMYERQLAECDNRETKLDEEVDSAIALLARSQGTVAAEMELRIERAGQDRLALKAERAAISQRLRDLPARQASAELTVQSLQARAGAFPLMPGELLPASPDADVVLDSKGNIIEFTGVTMPSIREALAPWVTAIGPPLLERRQRKKWRPEVELHWPLVDAVVKGLRQTKPPDYGPEAHDVTDTPIATVLSPGKPPRIIMRSKTR